MSNPQSHIKVDKQDLIFGGLSSPDMTETAPLIKKIHVMLDEMFSKEGSLDWEGEISVSGGVPPLDTVGGGLFARESRPALGK